VFVPGSETALNSALVHTVVTPCRCEPGALEAEADEGLLPW